MNKILNPFDYLSTGKALGWGLLGALVAIGLIVLTRCPIEWSVSGLVPILSTNLLLWFPLSTLLYLAALVFSPSRIRAVDIYASNLFALLPTIVIFAISNLISYWLASLNLEPRSFGDMLGHVVYNLLVIILSVSMVWSMVWGCFAYFVSANLKDWRGVVIFVACYVFVSVVIQLFVTYFIVG